MTHRLVQKQTTGMQASLMNGSARYVRHAINLYSENPMRCVSHTDLLYATIGQVCCMKLLSLFSGCGGMDIGFEGDFLCLKKSINSDMHPEWIKETHGDWVKVQPTSFETVFANDIRPEAKAAWCSYFNQSKPESVYHLGSIVELVKESRAGGKIFPEDIDIVTGGFPCQDFSVSGKRLGLNSQKSHLGLKLADDEPTIENRGHLYIWMRDVISLTSPKMFVAENVKGLTNLEDVKQVIEHDFSKAGKGGYLVIPAKVLSADNYGVPQSRERVIFFGFRNDLLRPEARAALSQDEIPQEYDPYPVKTHGAGLWPYVTCADAFAGLSEPELSSDPSQKKYSKAKYMGTHCQGQTEVRLNSVGPTIRSEHHGNIEFRRLSREHGGRHEDELKAGLQERRLSVRECARIQTFPDNYQFIIKKQGDSVGVSASEAYKIIGNALPCVMAYHLAKNLESKWDRYFGTNP